MMFVQRNQVRAGGRRVGVAATIVGLVMLMVLAAGGLSFTAWAQSIDSTDTGEIPTTGGMRPGPVGQNPPTQRRKGVTPVAIKIETAQVNSEIEQVDIVNGVMQNPSGPYIVAWYRGLGKLGENKNIVMSGHVDYYNAPNAVFQYLGQLQEGDKIEVTGTNGDTYVYSVEWTKSYEVASLDQATIDEIVGDSDSETLTLITCTGTFDSNSGEYDTRLVVRAKRED
jgi:LPXTG-site transpeptidase (sortase) family protein